MSTKSNPAPHESAQLPLAVQAAQPLALAPSGEPSVGQMLQQFIAAGVTADNVSAFEKLVALRIQLETRDAEKQFNAAFTALQGDLPVIVAQTVIPNRGKYEKFEDVMSVVSPLLRKHGFSVSFDMQPEENRVRETCTLAHVGGHARKNSFAVRLGRADTETQADCKAATTAKRNALLNALNIVIRQDVLQSEDSPENDGAPISWEQAETLKNLVAETASDAAAFLRFAGAKTFDEIGSVRYAELFAALNRKLNRK